MGLGLGNAAIVVLPYVIIKKSGAIIVDPVKIVSGRIIIKTILRDTFSFAPLLFPTG
jgi:hypothetical protein